MTLCEDFASFLCKESTIPTAVRSKAKLRIIDALGCMISGSSMEYMQPVIANMTGRQDGYRVIGTARRGDKWSALFLNAAFLYAFEIAGGGAWGGSVGSIVPAALTTVDALPDGQIITGEEFLTAIIKAAEVQMRVAEWVGFEPERYVGWHTPAFHGAIGSAAACGQLVGLSERELANALAIAADFAGGGLIQSRNNSKRMHMGRSPQSGMLACDLALSGIEGGLDILEDPRWGYFRTLRFGASATSPSDALEESNVLNQLGSEFNSFDKMSYKYYPFHSSCQGIIDNVRTLRVQAPLTAETIGHITVEVSTFVYEHSAMLQPAKSTADANFSLPYAVALALQCDPLPLTAAGGTIDPFVMGIDDPVVKALEELVTIRQSADLDKENPYTMDSALTIALKDGTEVRARSSYGRAARQRTSSSGAIGFASLGEHEIVQKFRNLVAGNDLVDADTVIEAVYGLDMMPDSSAILDLMSA